MSGWPSIYKPLMDGSSAAVVACGGVSVDDDWGIGCWTVAAPCSAGGGIPAWDQGGIVV